MTNAALIVAAGRGTRAGPGIAKQWRPLAGKRVADWTLSRFLNHPKIDQVIIVVHPDDREHLSFYDGQIHVVDGGESRDLSVRNGLAALAALGPCANVLIHDVARPLVSDRIISDVLEALAASQGAAPGLAVVDALWRGTDGQVGGTQDRMNLYRAQTPQGFVFDALWAAHQAHPGGALDDVEVARSAGIAVTIVPGDPDNFKITHPADFARAEKCLGGQMDIRVGNGYDVHRFGPGDHVILCGVPVAHSRSLQGHSDADVGMHAVTDAIYGALAEGDIGQHFPPSDPQWKGAASEIFLRHAVDLARSRGYQISNVDCTLVCEYPKIGPHAPRMRAEMGRIMGLDVSRVSVKATTSERLGFTGRGEGISATASVCLISAPVASL